MDFKKYNEDYSRIEKERKALDRREQSLSNKFVNELIRMNRKCKFFKTKDVYIYLDSHWKSSETCHIFNGFSVYTGKRKDKPTLLMQVHVDLSDSMEPCGEEEFVREVHKKVKKTLDKYLSEMEGDETTDYYWK